MIARWVGTVVVALLVVRSSTARVALHHLRHPGNWPALARLQRVGVLETTRRHALVAVGFREQTR